MANNLDLEEQEQLDQLKHFWNQYGNSITWLLIVVLGGVAAWNGYQWWERNQSAQAAAMYDEVERMVQGGDVAKAERAFVDMKDRFSGTVYAPQSGLLLAKMAYAAGKKEAARDALAWVSEKASDKGLSAVAQLRLAGLQMEDKSFDAALMTLNGVAAPEFSALVADRRGDIFALQGKKEEAKAQYLLAFKAFEPQTEYRRLVEVKLNALGVDPGSANLPAGPDSTK
jgi:predicted negative regulator of RcsB-dependent stress response